MEDLKPLRDAGMDAGPAADGGKSGGHAGKAGGSAGSGGSDAAVSGDSGEPADTGAGGSGGNAAGSSGMAGHAGGQPASGSGASGGSSGSAGSGGGDTVHGKILDTLHHAVPDVMIAIGDKSATSDAQGAFTISGVGATYDALLTINTSVNNLDTRISWLVQGLTRRDPTLQVYRGLADRGASVEIHITNVTFPLPDMQKIVVGWSGPDGDFTDDIDSADTDYLSPAWVGPSMTLGTAHALRFNYAGAQDLPTDYLAHDSHAVGIVADTDPGGDVTFDLGGTTKPASGTVSGNVTGSTATDRRNEVFVRFTDTAALLVVNDYMATGSFSYIVPNLPNAVIDVVAKNVLNNGGYAAAIADNVAPNQSGITLNIPTIPTLTAPADGKTNVDQTTLFQWTGDAKVFLFCAYSQFNYDALCVLTSQKETHLPAAPTIAGMGYDWFIEVHDDFADIDAASGSDGFISSYASGYVRGPKRGNSRYAESSSRAFTSAP